MLILVCLPIQGSRVLSRPGPTRIDLFTISKAPYYHNDAFHRGLRCLVDANPTFYLGGSTIGADEAINDRDVQTGLSQYWAFSDLILIQTVFKGYQQTTVIIK